MSKKPVNASSESMVWKADGVWWIQVADRDDAVWITETEAKALHEYFKSLEEERCN